MSCLFWRYVILATVVPLVLSMTGCYESPADMSLSLSSHKRDSSQYTGKKDPLLAKLKSDELQEQLRGRFRQAQDR